MAETYTTIAGDTFDIAAYKVFGDCGYTDKIINLNPKHRETVIFSAGIILELPEKIIKVSPILPPWKRAKNEEI
jgi:phage tail protein X